MKKDGSIVRFRTRGSSRRRKRLWQHLVPVNQIHLYLSYYISCSIHGLEFTSEEYKQCSFQQSNWRRNVCRETSRFWGIQKIDPCMHMEEDLVWIQNNLAHSLSCKTKAWWKLSMTYIVYQNSYSEFWDDELLIHGKLSWWQKKCYLDMFQLEPCHNVMS